MTHQLIIRGEMTTEEEKCGFELELITDHLFMREAR